MEGTARMGYVLTQCCTSVSKPVILRAGSPHVDRGPTAIPLGASGSAGPHGAQNLLW